MKILSCLLVNVLALLIVSHIVPGFIIRDFRTAVIAAIIIGLVNTFIKPIFTLITLPLTILTFGFFSFILNVLMLMLAASLTPGFHIAGFFTAIIASICLSLTSSFLYSLTK